jgi:chemotaxis protein methyltransferase CheR
VDEPWEDDLAAFIQERFGFQLQGHRKNVLPVVRERLAARRQLPAAWVEALRRTGPADAELRWLIEAFTIGETTFGRDPEQLAGVADALRQRGAGGRRLRVWSAACATGEEAFTLAMILAEAELAGEVRGTDLNEASVAAARNGGPYSTYRLMPLSPAARQRWFRADGQVWSVNHALRQRVTFGVHNLLAPALTIEGGWDAIVCRNVLIYFSPETAAQVIERLVGALAPDGLLFLGASDPTLGLGPAVRRVSVGSRVAYRRAAEVERAPAAPARSAPAAQRPTAGPTLSARPSGAADPRLERGALKLSQHDFAGALTELRGALEAAPGLADGQYLVGVCLLKQRATGAAAAALEEALRLDREHWPALVLLAGVCVERRQLLQAEVHYRRARQLLHSGRPRALSVRAAALVSSAHSDPAETARLVDQELEALTRAQLRAPAP